MCDAVFFQQVGADKKIFFSQRQAQLPLIDQAGRVRWVAWGRRAAEPGVLPIGGWADLSSIRQKKWQAYFPKSVRIAVQSFREQHIEGAHHWFTVTPGSYIQGLLASDGLESRVYVVTISPDAQDQHYWRWPRLLGGSS